MYKKVLSLVAILILVLPVVLNVSADVVFGQDDCDNCCCEPGTVIYLGKDTITKGDWVNAAGSPIGVYGSYAHILPNAPADQVEVVLGSFSVPAGEYEPGDLLNPPYNWTPSQVNGLPYHMAEPPYWDEYVSKTPLINYSLTGTLYNGIQYPAFEWVWGKGYDETYIYDDYGQVWNTTDPRACWFNTTIERTIEGDNIWVGGPGTRLTCWDCGAERGFPDNGYINVTLEFPEGFFMLSLYAYDFERDVGGSRTSQTVYITDVDGNVLAVGVMEDEEFDNGIYLNFLVCGPTTIIVHIVKDEGSINTTLSGIFVDKLDCAQFCGLTIGFWKTNAAKDLKLRRGHAQVDKDTYLEVLDCVNDTFGNLIGDWSDWGIGNHGTTMTEDDLEYALHWLSYGAYRPEDGDCLGCWKKPLARDIQVKARAQLLALLLTVCYKHSSMYGYALIQIDDDWFKISELIDKYNDGDYSWVYSTANYINENCGWLFGVVDP